MTAIMHVRVRLYELIRYISFPEPRVHAVYMKRVDIYNKVGFNKP